MKPNLLLVVMLSIGSVAAASNADTGSERIRIELTPGNRLDYGDIVDVTYIPLLDDNGTDRYSEAVIDTPMRYSVVDTFFICVQPQQDVFQKHGAVTDDPQFYDNDGTPFYSVGEVDCIISVCTILDPAFGECVIIDSNKDEDLTNDPVLQYRTDTLEFGDTTYDRIYVDTEAMVEYYDGTGVRTMTVPFRFFHTAPVYGRGYRYRLNTMQVGEMVVDDDTYTVCIPNYHTLELVRSQGDWHMWGGQRVWIDTNRNGRFEWSDFYDNFKGPDTLLNATYRGIEIDRFGSYLVLEKLDSTEHPPVAVGLPTPIFSAETLGGDVFDLAAQRGRYVLMDFWGSWCGPCMGELPHLKEAYEQFGKEIQFVSIGVEDDRNALVSCIKEHDLD